MSILMQRLLSFYFDLDCTITYKPSMQNRSETALIISPEEVKILLKHFPKGICSFDLEMTGLSALFDKVIEIAACKIEPDGKVTTFHSLVNPLITIPEHTIEYHGLHNEDLRDAPTLKKPLKDFIDFYGNTPLLAHNAKFDISFIIRGIHEYNYPVSLSDIYDSCIFPRTLYKKADIKPKSFKLGDLADFFDIKFIHHIALEDSVVAMKVFARCLMYFDDQAGDKSLKDLAYLFKLNSFKPSGNYILGRKHVCLKEFVQNKTNIQIKYSGGSYKNEFREVKPISLMALPNGLVLYALCVKSQMNKYFILKKIKDIKE